MSQELQNQLDDANRELRLRPSKQAEAAKERVIAEMAEAFRAELSVQESSRQFAESFKNLVAIDHPEAFEPHRCRNCGHLVKTPGYCAACKAEGQDWL